MHQQAVVFSQKRTRALLWALGLSFLAITVPIVGLHHNVDQIRATNSNLERQATHNERELTRTRNAVIFGLAKLAESRDNDTGEHLDRIRKYVEIISRDLANHCNDIDEEFTRNISLASSLHDIGKVGIPDSILLKPGRLTPEERSMMQIHTLIGGECLDAIHARLGNNPFMHMARQIAYYHHERWDGEGYPHQLKEYDIPLVARIVAVADVYDALTSKRPYKRAMSHLESRAIIVSGSGSQFDPEVVAAFIRHEDEFEAISRGQQSLSDDQAKSAFAKLHGEAQAASEKEAQTS
jgi:response regulator RpfG family c-di-GMP phosphodiesterase